jgi:sec-independent protein translocase protein TatB
VFNLPTGGEFIIILLVALLVLGPEKLPDAVRKFGRMYGELRRMANGFTSELRDALDEPGDGFKEMKDGFIAPLRSLKETADEARRGFLAAADEPVIKPGQVVQQSGPEIDDDVVLPGEDVSDYVPDEGPVSEDPSGEHGLVELTTPDESTIEPTAEPVED